jgi:17 kDa outer membrane surface antigen
MGYKARLVSCNRARAAARLILCFGLGFAASGCSLTMHLTSFAEEPETTASISPRNPTRLDPSLDDEDWRRAQSALSLAVDPQGPGLPVNWDNPVTKRKGSFAASGEMTLVQDTICRPFTAALVQPGGQQSRQSGQACRVGPGEWAMRLDAAPGKSDAGKSDANKAGDSQPLPKATTSTLQALDKGE